MLRFLLQLSLIIIFSLIFLQYYVSTVINDIIEHDLKKKWAQHTFQGTLHYLSTKLDSLDSDEQKNYISQIRPAFGYDIELRSIGSFTSDIQKQLNEGGIITTQQKELGIKLKHSDNILLFNDFDSMPERYKIPDEGARATMGDFFLIQQNLEQIPQSNWAEYIKELNIIYPYPVTIVDETKLPKSLKILATNSIPILGVKAKNSDAVNNVADLLFQKIGDSKQYIQIGPLQQHFLHLFFWDIVRLYLLVAFTLLLPIIIWLLPTWRALANLSQSTKHFAAGKLNFRAQTIPGSQVNQLVNHFNSMADSIQELFAAQTIMTTAISHDLRTPLARLVFLTTLSKDSKGKEKENYYQLIEKTIDELDALIKDALTYSSLECNTNLFEMNYAPIEEWLSAELALYTSLYPKLEFRQKIETIETFPIEKIQMRRALQNLLDNASRYANKIILISVCYNSGLYELSVEDDGAGIAESDKEVILKPFTKLEKSRSPDNGGIGLGLTIVRLIAERHNGKVSVTKSPLGGAKFTIHWKGSS